MAIILRNEIMSVKISRLGAEVVEIKRHDLNCSYLWSGDQNYWGGHSPVLFPIVCSAMNNQIKVDGRRYAIKNHGFARNSEFELVDKSECYAVFQLEANEKTVTIYPFKFLLEIKYTLAGNRLQIDYLVCNKDNLEIYFQLGTHPAFNCPLEGGLAFENYYLEFEQPEDLERRFINSSILMIPDQSELIGRGVTKLPLTRKLFDLGTLVFPQVKSNRIFLKSDNSARSIAVSYENMEQLGIWQPKDAPFICIEPWHGLPDVQGFNGEFKDREAVVKLETGKTFNCQLCIETY